MPSRRLPIVGIPACVRRIKERVFHTVSEKYPNAVIEAAQCLPLLIPAVGPQIDPWGMLDALDGLLLTGSPSNVHPREYGCEPSYPDILHDPARDATTLPLIREAVRRDLPILAICRGIQELNVALGGTLHQRVHEIPGRLNHRSRRESPDGPYGPAHAVALTEGGILARLVGGSEAIVNSLHSQGIDRLAASLYADATAPDGQIEAVSMPSAKGFVLGVQWHPEWRWAENELSRAIFSSFGEALTEQRS